MGTKKKNIGLIALLVTTLIWGTSFVILKNALDSIPTLYIMAVRFSGAAIIMAVAGAREWKKADITYVKAGILMGVCMFLAYVFQTYGLVYTTPGKNAFLTTTYCIIVPFVHWIFKGRRPDRFNVFAALMCVAGVGLISLDSGMEVNKGDVLTVVCGLFFALHIIVTARYVRGRNTVLLTAIQFSTAALLSWISAFISGPFPRSAPAGAWIAVAYLCVMCTAVCFWLQAFGQKYTHPSQVAVVMTLESVFGAAISILFFNEKISLKVFCGFAAVFIAVIISETKLSFLRKKKSE